MMWLQDTGILSKLKMDFLPHGRPKPRSPKLRHNLTLSVWHLITPLIMQAVGTAVALLAFGVELILAKKKSRRRRSRHRQVSSNENSIALIWVGIQLSCRWIVDICYRFPDMPKLPKFTDKSATELQNLRS